jgi:hypothetical protein
MSKVRQISNLVVRLALVCTAMLIAYVLGTIVIGQINANELGASALSPQETTQAGKALLLVSVVSALVLSFLILRSRWHGLKLVGATFVVHFGVETLMTQVETLYFNSAVQMGPFMLGGIIAAGAVRALVFAPLAVLILGKMGRPARRPTKGGTAAAARWDTRFVALSLLYVAVYFTFGYFVAWQWEETRLYYTGTTAIKPFFTHFWELFTQEDPAIVPFQVLRGALWTLLSAVIAQMMMGAKRWHVSLAVALTFVVLVALPLGVFPNPYMPPVVARSHFVELASSMLLFGTIAGWTMYRKEGQAVATSPAKGGIQRKEAQA